MKQGSQLGVTNIGAFYKTPKGTKSKCPVPNYGEV